jgi:ribosomal protein S27E
MKQVKCERCGQLYPSLPPSGVGHALLSERKFFDVAPELRASVACPNCGHEQESAQYKFFGILSAQAMRILIAIILVAMVVLGIALQD